MLVTQHTKIAALLKHRPEALEALVTIHPKLEKLRNPFLRRLMAGRVSIEMAAKIAGCLEDDFFRVLKPLGFEIAATENESSANTEGNADKQQSPEAEKIITLDVRPILAGGQDPLKEIMETVKTIKAGEALKVINTFEPTPLILLLKKKGFSAVTSTTGPEQVETVFFRQQSEATQEAPKEQKQEGGCNKDGWQEVLARFADNLRKVDVRELEMPQPMMTILESLENLPKNSALYVVHKRMPVFLLPELTQQGFDYRSQQLSDNEVHLLIFRN